MKPRNIFLIAKREYLTRVRTKAFIISTLLIPALMLMWTIVPSLLLRMRGGDTPKIVIVTDKPQLGEVAKKEITRTLKQLNNSTAEISLSTAVTDADRQSLERDVTAKKISGFLWMTDAAIADGKVSYSAREAGSLLFPRAIESGANAAVRKERLFQRGLTEADIEAAFKPIEVATLEVKAGGSQKKNDGPAAFIIPFMLAMSLYMTVFIYGMQVMQSIVEEKTSRVMEVMLATCSARDMMAGKVLGVGLVGLTQLLLWVGTAVAVSVPALFAGKSLIQQYNIEISPLTVILLPVYYLLGYFVYSSLYAAIGASVNSIEETQNLQWVVALPIIIAFMMTFYAINQPASTVTMVASLFPFFTPLIMMVRIATVQPPLWQVLLSIVLMCGTIYVLITFCAKIYRVGILMYGKRATLPEIIKWARYS